MKLFELRCCWTEEYDCPDNGRIKVCDTYDTIAFSVGDDSKLKQIANELNRGYNNGFWSVKRSNELRSLYPNYDEYRDCEYKIVDVSDLIIRS